MTDRTATVHRPEIELLAGALAICDLHLDLASEAASLGFVRWLDGLERVPQLIVLGDLFDVWVGPAQAGLPGAPGVLDALGRLVDRGTGVLVVHGNRDFLLGASFERRTGARVLPDGFVGRAGDERLLFVHGDELCTLDRGYLRLRRVVRSRPVTWLAPRVPLGIAVRIARRLRRASTEAVRAKPIEEKSMQTEAARSLAALERAGTVICGHAHEFRDRELPGGARWIVLDAYGGRRDALLVGAGGRVEPTATATFAASGGA